jgi:multidrug efflux system membrane fusion protein
MVACSSAGSTTDPPATGGGGKGKGKGKGEGGAVPVVVATVTQRDVPIELTVVGNVEAYSTVSIRPQISGQLVNVHFKEGDFVKKDALLFTIDSRPIEATIAQLEANLSKDLAQQSLAEANLKRDSAQADYARQQAIRYQKLFDEKVVSKEQVEQMASTADAQAQVVQADRAAIESAKAQAVADRAAIANARVQLSYTTIRSPLDGRTGNLTVKLGNIVTANTTDMIGIVQVEPMYVTFSVPEARLADVKRYNANGKLPVIARPQDGGDKGDQGSLTFIDNAVDMTTGTIKLKGTFPNRDHRLWPGQFVNVVLRLTTQPNAVVVPNQAVQTGQDGLFVYVVKEDRTVEARKVTTGPRVAEDLVINSGLQVGETIVTEGQLRLAPNSRVQFGEGRKGGGGGGGRGKPSGN